MVRQSRNGFTLLELMIVLAVVGVFTAMAAPEFGQWRQTQRVKDASRSLARAFTLARTEAIRTGNNHIVFMQKDTLDNPLVDTKGRVFPIQVIDDQRPGDPNQNCRIDAGEVIASIGVHNSLSWGLASSIRPPVPSDVGTGDPLSGSTFTDGGGNDVTWVLFGPQGTPSTFTAACVIGGVASGGGGAYFSNGSRDYAAVVNPLGGVRIHAWMIGENLWTQ